MKHGVEHDQGEATARELVGASALALVTAEFALAGHMSPDAGLEAVAAQLDAALRRVGVDLRSAARLVARPHREQHGVTPL